MRLYIQKDKANDQAYIGFRSEQAGKRGSVKKTVRVTDDIAVDLDARGRLLGMDVANARRVLGKEALADAFSGDELVGVAEAAKLRGVRKPNFIRDFASRPDFPKPVVELASGRIWRRSDILDFLDRINGILDLPSIGNVGTAEFAKRESAARRLFDQRSKTSSRRRPAASRSAIRPKAGPRGAGVSR